MRYVRWGALFAAVAVVVACTPFNKPLQSDGGAGTSGAASDGAITDSVIAGAAPNGTACTFDTDCRFGHCVEGVCCENVCSSKCVSCRQSNTGQIDGRCSAVKAGRSHGNDCIASAPSTCGLDGKCDGAGDCEVFSSATICGVEACPSGSSTGSAPAKCDGKGSCNAGATMSCGTYACAADGVNCRTTCTLDTDCAVTAYCDDGVCKPRIEPGKPCTRAAECTSGLCGGLCCDPGTPCLCTQQSATNVFANAGFDKDLSGWEVFEASWANLDVEKCPFSGSLYSTAATGYPRQCARISPGTKYYAGLSVYVVSDAGSTCEMTFYDDTNCMGNVTLRTTLFAPSVSDLGKWNRYTVEMDATANSRSALLDCDVNFGYLDQIFLTPVPGSF